MTNNLSDLINLKKYDISAIGSKPYEALISLCHKQIDTNGLCLLPDFVKKSCLLYTSPSPRDLSTSRMPSSA